MTPFRNFVFCATDFYLANGIPEWIFLLYGCRTNQINIYSPKGGSVQTFFGTFLLCFNFLIFWFFWKSRMDFPLAQIWSLLRSQLTPKMSCIGNCIKKSPFCNFVFCATDFYLANGIPEWIFLLYGCRTNQINIYSPKGGSVKPIFWYFFAMF